MAPATVFVNMTGISQSGGRRSSPAALRGLYERFTRAISADDLISSQLSAWSHARSEWRTLWNRRGSVSSEFVFQRLISSPASAGRNHWAHPLVDAAPELDSWMALWRDASSAERDEIATTLVRVIAMIESEPASASEGCALLATSALGHGLPLAALTPALSSLDPVRFVVLCDAWLQTLRQYEGSDLPKDVGAYPDLNVVALRWLAAAEGEVLPEVFVGSPPADRLGALFSWIVRTNADAAAGSKFDVTQKKYKDWPPMW